MTAHSAASALPRVGELVFENVDDLFLISFAVESLFHIHRRRFVFAAISISNAVFGIRSAFFDRFVDEINGNGRHPVEKMEQ